MSYISWAFDCSGALNRKDEGRAARPSLTLDYLRGGLLPRPGPDGLPVLLGAFSRFVCMVYLQN